jgi:hypothetical protein
MISAFARSKVWVCCGSLPGIVGLKPAGGMDVSVVGVMCCEVRVTASG